MPVQPGGFTPPFPPSRKGRWAVVSLALLLSLALAGVARADGEFEPNDDIAAATVLDVGPTYAATVETTNDRDWFAFHLAGGQQVAFVVTPESSTCDDFSDRFRASVRGAEGKTLTELNDEGGTYRYTTPKTGFYYVTTGDEAFGAPKVGCRYQFSAGPASAGAPAPPAPARQPAPEPNETAAQAYGPLNPGVRYDGTIETANDVDALFFYAFRGRQVDVELTQPDPLGDECYLKEVEVALRGAGITSDNDSVTLDGNARRVVPISVPSDKTHRYTLAFTSPVGCHWQAMLSPATAIANTLDTTAPSASPECRAARRQRARMAVLVKQAKRRVRHASTSASARRARSLLRSRRRALRRANHAVATSCRT